MRSKVLLLALVLCLIGLGAEAAQTCRDDIPATAPDSRFQVNGDGTVTDLATGLIWKQCAEGLSGAGCTTGSAQTFTWQQALQRAEVAVFAGSSLWRLPNKNELASLVERRCFEPAINATPFPNIPSSWFWDSNTPSRWFWSSSPAAGHSDSAWTVNFSYGRVTYYSKSYHFYVRLVRGGQ
jgi:hypothetical protein